MEESRGTRRFPPGDRWSRRRYRRPRGGGPVPVPCSGLAVSDGEGRGDPTRRDPGRDQPNPRARGSRRTREDRAESASRRRNRARARDFSATRRRTTAVETDLGSRAPPAVLGRRRATTTTVKTRTRARSARLVRLFLSPRTQSTLRSGQTLPPYPHQPLSDTLPLPGVLRPFVSPPPSPRITLRKYVYLSSVTPSRRHLSSPEEWKFGGVLKDGEQEVEWDLEDRGKGEEPP